MAQQPDHGFAGGNFSRGPGPYRQGTYVTTDTILKEDDAAIILNGGAGVALTLPTIALFGTRPLWVRNEGAGALTLSAGAGNTVLAGANITVAANTSACVQPVSATNWTRIA